MRKTRSMLNRKLRKRKRGRKKTVSVGERSGNMRKWDMKVIN